MSINKPMIINVNGFAMSGSSAVVMLLKDYGFEGENKDNFEFDPPLGLITLGNILFSTISSNEISTAIKYFRIMSDNALLFDHITLGRDYDSEMISKMKDAYDDFITEIADVDKKSLSFDCYNEIFMRERRQRMGFLFKQSSIPFIRKIGDSITARNLYRIRNCYIENNEFSVNYNLKVDREEFVMAGRRLMNRLITIKYGDKDMIVQNMVLAGHFNHLEYFEDFNFKTVCVWRDPRDHYIKWAIKSPGTRVFDFIKYYKKCMQFLEPNDNYISVRLEDLIFDESRTRTRLEEYLRIPHKKIPHKFFKPEESASMAYVFRNDKIKMHYKDDIRIIERELPEYLFDFSKYKEYYNNLPVIVSWRYNEDNLPF